jgi:hypothetical protein
VLSAQKNAKLRRALPPFFAALLAALLERNAAPA